MNTAVTDPGKTVIAADAVLQKGGGARDTAAHQRMAGNATVHERVAARHSAPGEAGPDWFIGRFFFSRTPQQR